MLRIIEVIALAAALTACGDFTVEQPKDEQEQAEGEEAEREGGHVGETSEQVTPADTSTEAADSTKTQVDHTAPAADPDRPLAIFAPQSRDWPTAVRAAPEGYHMATRAELVDLVDRGIVFDLGAAGAELWTSTEESLTVAIFVDGDSGRTARMGKTMIMQAVYVIDGGAQ